MPVLKLLQATGRLPYFAAAMVFGGLANGLAFLVLSRMHSLDLRIGFWRTQKDWALYRQYWRVAPRHNWSRAPIIFAVLSFVTAACLLWMSVRGVQVPR